MHDSRPTQESLAKQQNKTMLWVFCKLGSEEGRSNTSDTNRWIENGHDESKTEIDVTATAEHAV
eukprot:6486860-Amphidinium_carterae.1